jgi:phosphoserine phosphatase
VWDERCRKYYLSADKNNRWAEEDAADLAGRPLHTAEQVLHPIPYSPGAREFLEFTKGRLVRGLLSGCVDMAGKKAAAETDMEFCFCNTLHTRDGVFCGTLDYAVSTWHKHLLLPEICQKYGVLPEEICHVGDNDNDIPVFERVGLAVAFRPKTEEVKKMAKYVIDDFRELNQLLELHPTKG